MKKIIIPLFGALACLSCLQSCTPKEEPVPTQNPEPVVTPVKVESITLDQTEVVLDVNGVSTVALKATVSPANADYNGLTWSSDNTKVATVDAKGNVVAVGLGNAKVTVSVEGVSTTCSVTVKDVIKTTLIDIYNKMDGPNWKKQKNWCSDAPIAEWEGVWMQPERMELHVVFSGKGLKGQLPESLGDLGEWLVDLQIGNEPDLTGTLPESFSKLVRLSDFRIRSTGIESLPDVFGGLTELSYISISSNPNLTGTIPESLGSSDKITDLSINNNYFTGSIYDSWVKLEDKFNINNNCLSGTIPPAFLDTDEHLRWFVEGALVQKSGYGFDISGIEIPGGNFWPEGSVKDLEGSLFSFDEVIHDNKYTVYLMWAPWCTFSKALLPRLKDYYNIYKQDGLEVIATVQLDIVSGGAGMLWSDFAGQKKEVDEKGYGIWYNYYYPDYLSSFMMSSPHAEVYDQNGHVLFSSIEDYPDPVRNRFGKIASTDLIPFLETVLGPEEPGEVYSSTDFSKDGEVLTLQKAAVGKGINVVFMGDGYTDKDMAAGGVYETLMKTAMEEFFEIEPYKTFRNRFNVYAVKAVSLNNRIGSGYSTALQTYFGNGTYVGGNNERCEEYALKVPGITSVDNLLTVVLINSRHQSGTASLYQGTQSGIAYVSAEDNDPEFFGPTLRHEAGGHGFAFLADEYASHDESAPKELVNNYNMLYNTYGWYSNVDFTSSPTEIRWSAFLSDDRYKDEVGIHEGGALYTKGTYRPSVNSMMRENIEFFNAPSRWAIYKQIMVRSGESASFDKFLEYDAVNREAAKTMSRSKSNRKWTPTAQPVVLP